MREMRIVSKTRDQVPVQMRHHIAEAGQIDFLRLQNLALRSFYLADHLHQGRAFRYRQIGHFPDVRIPDHAAKAGVIRIVDQHDAQLRVAEDDFTTRDRAQFTCRRHAYTSTRSMPPLLARATYSGSQFGPSKCLAISTTM